LRIRNLAFATLLVLFAPSIPLHAQTTCDMDALKAQQRDVATIQRLENAWSIAYLKADTNFELATRITTSGKTESGTPSSHSKLLLRNSYRKMRTSPPSPADSLSASRGGSQTRPRRPHFRRKFPASHAQMQPDAHNEAHHRQTSQLATTTFFSESFPVRKASPLHSETCVTVWFFGGGKYLWAGPREHCSRKLP
jgi:hypothetical protein